MLRRSLLRALECAHSTRAPFGLRPRSTTAQQEAVKSTSRPHSLDPLSALRKTAFPLRFRSMPYNSDPSLLFPQSPLQFSHTSPLFTLRCFPSPKSRPSSAPSRPPSPSTLRPTPVPSLVSTTSRDPNRTDPFLSTLAELRTETVKRNERKKTYVMDLTVFASKKKVSKLAVVRERSKRRFREAVRLVVARGAQVDRTTGRNGKDDGTGQLRLREDDVRKIGPRRYLLPGFHYVASIGLEMYRAPLQDVVEQLDKALKSLRTKVLERKMEIALSQIPIPPPDPDLDAETLPAGRSSTVSEKGTA
ncbi:hypothetical protein JCM10212_004391 [Sporobolomyces blumeae]